MGSPPYGFASKLDALVVLAAGDLAVLTWWGAIFLFVCHRPQLEMGIGRVKPDDSYRSGHLVRICGADAFWEC